MKVKFKIILVVTISILMLIVGISIAVNQKKETIKYFDHDGYIIGNIYEKNNDGVQMVQFNEKSQYKNYSNNEFKFNDTDGKKTIVSKENFVHYTNESIMSLKDGVAIDLDDVDAKLLSYYNVFSGVLLYKQTEGYEIKNVNDTIVFNKLMFKISDNKYLVAADSIIAYFSEEQTVEFKKYVEIEYVDKNVVRLYNDESNYQTISSNLYLLINNVKIDLGYKTIAKNNIEYLTMADLVINSSDNIEILPEKPKEESKEEGSNNTGTNNNGGSLQNSINSNGNQQQNNIDTSILDGLAPIEPSEEEQEDTIKQPNFIFESLDVTRIGFENLKINMEDQDNLIFGDLAVQIIENTTGKIIETFKWEEGLTEYQLLGSYSDLKPNTEYTLTVSGKYKVEDVEHDRVFVSKIFKTLDIGLQIIEDYATSDMLSFAIYKTKYSDVDAITYDILDSNGKSILENPKKVEYNNSNYIIASSENNLNSNTKYKIVITNIVYADGENSDSVSTDNIENLKISHTMKTLKKKPFSSSNEVKLSSIYNQLNEKLTFKIENVNDVNSGVKSYTYKIYNNDIRDINNQKPIYVSKKDNSDALIVDLKELVENNGLIGGNSYFFNVEIEFDDNEKTIIYSTNNSNPIYINDTKYPKVGEYLIDENVVESTSLRGSLPIYDEDYYIYYNNVEYYKLILQRRNDSTDIETIDIIKPTEQTDIINLPIAFDNLKPNTDYVISVYLGVDDGAQKKYIYIGYEDVKTNPISPLYLELTNLDKEKSENLFEFTVNRKQQYDNTYIKNNLDYIKFDLIGCQDEQCKIYDNLSDKFTTIIDNGNDLNSLIEGNIVKLVSNKFSFYNVDYNSRYKGYGVLVKSYSASNYEIPVDINNSGTNTFKLNIIDTIPTVTIRGNYITNEEAKNKNSQYYDTKLNDSTQIGFKLHVEEIKSTKGIGINNFYYAIYDGECGQDAVKFSDKFYIENNEILSKDKEVSLVTSGITQIGVTGEQNIDIYFNDENNKSKINRGQPYCLVYQIDYIDSDTKETHEVNDFENIKLQAKKQSVEVKGYLKSYNKIENSKKSEIIFRLNINDIDSELVNLENSNDLKLYLVNASGNVVSSSNAQKRDECQNKLCDYNFSIENINDLSKYALVANIENTNHPKILYEFTLDALKFPDSPQFQVKDISGKLVFTLTNPGVDVLGLRIKSNGKENFLELEKTEKEDSEDLEKTIIEYVGKINNNELEDKYGINKKTNTIDLSSSEIGMIYSDGSINSDIVDGALSFLAIRQANLNLEQKLYYYNNLKNDFVFQKSYSVNSIYRKNNETIKSLIDKKEIKIENYIVNQKEAIGQTIGNNLVHLYNLSILNFNLKDFNKIPVSTDLLTNNTILYTSSGAILDFEIADKDIFSELHKIKFNLTCPSKTGNVEFAEYDFKQNTWAITNDKFIDAKYDSVAEVIKFELKNIKDYSNGCDYSLQYKKNVSDRYDISYNIFTGKENVGIITSLKSLKINNDFLEYEKKPWYIFEDEEDETKNDILFDKLLNYSFEVQQNYKLTDKETIQYKIILSNQSEKIIVSSKSLSFKNNSNIVSGKEFLNEVPAGEYNVTIEPSIYITDGESISLEPNSFSEKLKITRKDPTINIGAYQSEIEISVTDEDGVFKQWSGNEPIGSVNLTTEEEKNKIYNNKKYYFKLKTNKDSEDIRAYKEIGFNKSNLTIDVKNLFGSVINNNKYYAEICYYTITNDSESCEGQEVTLLNPETLNASLFPAVNSYILEFNNPDESIKDSIDKMRVSYIDNDGFEKTIIIEKPIFTKVVRQNGLADYYYTIIASNVKEGNFQVEIYSEDNIITTVK